MKIEGSNALAGGILLAFALLAALYVYLRSTRVRSLRDFFDFLVPVEIITHPSARADFLFWLTRSVLWRYLMLPAGAVFVGAMAYGVHKVAGVAFGIKGPLLGPAGPFTIVVFTLTMLLAYDISYYLYHVAQHRIPFLWELHKVHHSAQVLVGITKDRVHPLDELLNRMWDGVIPGICFGLWSLVALNPVEVGVFGLNVYVIRNILMMDFLRHTHLPISFGPLNHVIICPHWHQLHHSADTRHYDRNFGLLFSFWDRLFGTHAVPAPGERFRFGIGERESPHYQSLFGLYVLPLKKMAGHVLRLLRGSNPIKGTVMAPAPLTRRDETIEIVCEGARLGEIRDAWHALWQRCEAPVFQSPDWVLAWWNALPAHAPRHLRIALVWRGGVLVAAMPLATRRWRGLRILEWAAQDCADYCDALLDPAASPMLIERLWAGVRAQGGFDVAMLGHLLPGATARVLLNNATGMARFRVDRRLDESQRICGPFANGEAWLNTYSKKVRQNYRRACAILQESGEFRFRLMDPDEPVQPVLAAMAAFKRAALARKGLQAPLFDEDSPMLAALVQVLAQSGQLRLFVLEQAGQPIAVSVNLQQGNSLMAFVTSFDQALEKGSPGYVLMIHYIMWAFDHGLEIVDFLRGAEAFKRRLACTSVALATLSAPASLPGALALWLDGWRRPPAPAPQPRPKGKAQPIRAS